jgi:hypothetical protein
MSKPKLAAVPREQEWLNPAERDELRALESAIERGLKTFMETGEALARVRDRRLYREGHETFEQYCQARWGFRREAADRYVRAAAVVPVLNPTGLAPPSTESVARELAPLLPEPDKMRAVWVAVGPDATAAQVRAEVKRLTAPTVADELPAEPPRHPGDDIRFSRIENAADSLVTLPALDKLIWPVEPGDVRRMDLAFAFLTEWLPAAKAAWKAHKALLAKAARQERDAKRGLRAA